MKKNQRGFSAVEGLLVLIVVVLVAGAGWLIYHRQNAKPKTLDGVLSSITSDAKNTYSNAVFEPKNDWTAEASATAFNKVAGYNYAVSGVGRGIFLAYENTGQSKTVKQFLFFNKTIPPANSLARVKNWVGSKLVSYGFTTTDNKTYKKADNTCTVLNDSAGLAHNDFGEASNLLDVSCFSKEVLQDAAAQMKPFVDEYLKENPTLKANDLTVGPLTIKSKNGSGVIGSSHAASYDIAEIVISTSSKKQIALYYAKDAEIGTNNNSGWHYVTQANDEFGFKCGDVMANPDARKAFYDQVCLSENGQVRLDTNNRALQ